MKEQFRYKEFKDGIKIKLTERYPGGGVDVYELKKDSGIYHWISSVSKVMNASEQIITEYEALNIRMTLRQLYYQLVAEGIIPNDANVYAKISNLLTDNRYVGRIDWDTMEDRGRLPSIPGQWENMLDILDSAVASYRLPRWRDQDYYLELFTEKEALTSVVKPITEKWHIHFCFNKGYSSASAMYGLSRRVMSKIKEGKHVVLLYLGDHDPSGMDMIRDINDRIEEFLTKGHITCEPDFQVIPIALTMGQIQKYNPPPNPAKISDPRAVWYIEKFGDKSWEVDALKPNVMMKLIDDKIKEYIDMEKYDAWLEKEKKEKEKLREFADNIEEEEDDDE
ncbi:hypothetical protein CMI37_35540 [Candidatus Pacearchaeota archaeon]|nr:hypothetical protein [Candidatus Pacearchaeota archaeon]|tara:strand:+ start:816 stop:1826 length:1011 start_codon:yes stop_codon:yes gene_type:complete